MEVQTDANVEDVDRESLVKEIEQIQLALGSQTNGAESETIRTSRAINVDIDGDDSDDELAIIKSPEYHSTSDNERFVIKHVPFEVISSESDDESQRIADVQHSYCSTPLNIEPESSLELNADDAYNAVDQHKILNNDVDLEIMVDNPLNTSQTELTDHGSLQLENNTNGKNEDYCLTELQPVTNESLQNIISTSVDENLKSYSTMCTDPEALSNDNEEVLLSDEDEQSIDQKQCLKLNRQYQAIIEAQLRKIERLITENKEKQLGLTQTSPAMANDAENLDFKGLQSFLPYFKSHRNKGPEDNEDTVLRKSIDQPSPFELPPRPWSIEEEKTLSDAVKSDVLQSKIKPLLQKVEALTPKPRKTPEEEKELEELNMAIDRLKNLSLTDLIHDFTDNIDFEDISNKVLPMRSPQQCQVYWYNKLHPFLNHAKWTKEEDKLLLSLAEKSTGGNWETIALELKTNRSPSQCLHRYQKSLNKNFLKSKWDAEEDRRLLEAVKICGYGAWAKVSTFLDGRTGAQCMHRYVKSVNPLIKKGRWNREEDKLLRKGVQTFGFNWFKIRNLLPRRTDAQIRERWQDVLDPNLCKYAFSKEEDEMLLKLVEEQNSGLKNWSGIAKRMPGRTDNACRRRWFVLTKNDPKTKKHLKLQKIVKDKLVNNFSRRSADRTEIGPEDFHEPDLSEQEQESLNYNQVQPQRLSKKNLSKKVVGLEGPKRKETKSLQTEQTSKLAHKTVGEQKQKRSQSHARPNGEQSMGGKLLVMKRKKNSKSKCQPKKTKKPPQKVKILAPCPSVVTQASSLPNGMPTSLLTQFSVLLQAFHVDVSGVLQKTSSETAQQSNLGLSANLGTGETSSTQATSTLTKNDSQDMAKTTSVPPVRDRQELQSHSSHSSTNINETELSQECSSSIPINQSLESNNENEQISIENCKHASENTNKLPENPGRKTVERRPSNKLDKADTIPANISHANNLCQMKSGKKRSYDGNSTSSGDVTVNVSPKRYPKRRRLNQHEINHNENLSDKENSDSAMTEFDPSTQKGSVRKSTVIGRSCDPISGIANNIVGVTMSGVATTSSGVATRMSGVATTSSGVATTSSGVATRMSCVATTSSGVATRMSGVATTTSGVSTTMSGVATTSSGVATSNIAANINVNKTSGGSTNTGAVANTELGCSPYFHVKRVAVNGQNTIPKVPAVPPLPPSATTLNAFKTLLTLRKDLQMRANRVETSLFTNNESETAVQQHSGENVPSRNSQKPGDDCLLLLSNSKQTSFVDYRNMIAYQQLLNRFKGLFMWPGFLSLVNPSISKASVEKPKKNKKRRTNKCLNSRIS